MEMIPSDFDRYWAVRQLKLHSDKNDMPSIFLHDKFKQCPCYYNVTLSGFEFSYHLLLQSCQPFRAFETAIKIKWIISSSTNKSRRDDIIIENYQNVRTNPERVTWYKAEPEKIIESFYKPFTIKNN